MSTQKNHALYGGGDTKFGWRSWRWWVLSVGLACAAAALGSADAATLPFPTATTHSIEFTSPTSHPLDRFGYSMSCDGVRWIVGAPDTLSPSSTQNPTNGFANVYRQQGDAWVLEARLDPAVPENGISAGGAVGIDGDVAVVGAPSFSLDATHENTGAVFVFGRTNLGWSQVAQFVGPYTSAHYFGSAVSLAGSTLVVGSPEESDPILGTIGTVHVYERIGGVWLPTAILTAPDAAVFDNFGSAVDLDGDTIVVGAPGHANSDGATYVFQRASGSWIMQQAIYGTAGVHDLLGVAVSLDGNDMAVSSRGDVVLGSTGHVSIYRRDSITGIWSSTQSLQSPAAPSFSSFGASIDLRDSLLLVGQTFCDGPPSDNVGRAFSFVKAPNGQFVPEAELVAPTNIANSGLGTSVAIGSVQLLVGASSENVAYPGAGGHVFAFDATKGIVHFGSGCPGSGNIVPFLHASGSTLSGSTLQLQVGQGVGGGELFLGVGTNQSAIPMGHGCTLLTYPLLPNLLGPLLLFPLGSMAPGSGSLSITALVPNVVGDISIFVQGIILDAGAAAGFSNSNAVRLDLTD